MGIILLLLIAYVVLSLPIPHESKGVHYGANQTTEFFDSAYANANVKKPEEKIAGITVNHHLLAPHLIAKEFGLVATDKPTTVVLVSPNHFFLGEGGAITSEYDWQTPYGVLQANHNIIKKLYDSSLVNIDERPFTQEHGINGIVGFIKKSLPQASIVPIIVKENLPDDKVDELAKKLTQVLPKDSLIVGSIDFSHYLPHNAAEFHDIQTLAVMNNFDYDRIPRLDIDSHPGLRLLLKYFDFTGNKKFVLTSHENSSTVTGNFEFVETTSYLNGYYTKGENPRDNRTTKLLFNGFDPSFATPDALDFRNPNYAFAKSDRLFKYNVVTTTLLNSQTKRHLRALGFNDFAPVSPAVIDLGSPMVAYGYVYDNLKLTDIYLFPLEFVDNKVQLLAGNKVVTLLSKIAPGLNLPEDLKSQILTGHVVIK